MRIRLLLEQLSPEAFCRSQETPCHGNNNMHVAANNSLALFIAAPRAILSVRHDNWRFGTSF